MNDAMEILRGAISDMGYWQWWTLDEHVCQLEFAGTQIWNPPESENQPPCNVIALRFTGDIFLSFLVRHMPGEYSKDWFNQLHNDEMEPPKISSETFFINDEKGLRSSINQATESHLMKGPSAQANAIPTATNTIAFYAGRFGVIAGGNELQIYNYQGEIKIENIPAKFKQWWDYWREYWRRIDTDDPLPVDYTCEVMLPAEGDDD